MNKEEKNLGTIILKARREKKLSQEALAEKLHISRQSISNWENNINLPDLNILEKMCKILELNFEDISVLVTNYPTKKRKSKVNKFIILSLLFMIIIAVFITLLIRFKNNFEVYSINIDDDNIRFNNGIFIKSNVNYYFQLGNLYLHNDDINNYKIRIYYKIKDEIKILIETKYNDNIIINERYGYGEYFVDSFNVDKVYIDLISLKDNNKTVTYKLALNQIFKNEKLFYFKNKGIEKKLKERSMDNIIITKEILLENNYNYENNNYIKKLEKGYFQFDIYNNVLYFYNDNVYLENNLNNYIISGRIFDSKKQEFMINFSYDFNEQKLICYSDDCSAYKEYINLMDTEVKLLQNK